jgi:hypothetical protein
MDYAQIAEKRAAFLDSGGNDADPRASLAGMEMAFQGRGDLQSWNPEVLNEIDGCFLDTYMAGDEINTSLFFPESADNYSLFRKYCNMVDRVLCRRANEVPDHAREYFAFYSIWQMRGYTFPVPLGTKSVVYALHKTAEMVKPGFVEVSCELFRLCHCLVSRLLC